MKRSKCLFVKLNSFNILVQRNFSGFLFAMRNAPKACAHLSKALILLEVPEQCLELAFEVPTALPSGQQ